LGKNMSVARQSLKQLSLLGPATLILAVVVLYGTPSAGADGSRLAQLQATGLLRVCADPDNLPFSSRDSQQPGYDVELAREIAQALRARAEIVWVPTILGRRAIRQLLEGKCDLFMGLPNDARFLSDNPRLTLSAPYYTLRHVLVSPTKQPIKDLNDLRDKTVAVEAMSLADIFLFQNGQRREISQTAEDAVQAVIRGDAQAAFVWAPIGWWLVKRHPEAQLQAADVSVPDLEFQLSVGMRMGDEEFRTAVDAVVGRLVAQATVSDILSRYGLPPPTITQAAVEDNQGRSLYFQICAPCHGEDATGGGPVPNLKTFAGTEDQFLRVALNGRPDRGMPAWKGKLTEDELRAILVFIQSLPK
jgi:ABC-type amino acid transport substrate-binding protein